MEQRTFSLQQQKEQLQRYITGIDDIGIGLCVIDSDYRLHNMNNTLIDRLGNLNDKRCHSVIMEQETPCPNCKSKEVIEQEQIVSYQVTRSDGRIIEIGASPIYNDDGSISCMEIIRDITDQKEQETQRLEINKQKEQLNKFESLKTMAGAIAHRFNNAMMVVNGNLELAMHTFPDSSEEYQMLSNAAEGASQVGSMMLSYVGQQPLYCSMDLKQIKDSGHGISPKDLSRIFEPFYTTRFVGRGLGLALTVGIIQSYHGAITVDSVPDQGTTVRLLLPPSPAIVQLCLIF